MKIYNRVVMGAMIMVSLICVAHQQREACATDLIEYLSFPNPGLKISMDFKSASMRDILKIFSIQSGLNFLAADEIEDKKLTLYLKDVPVKEAIDKIFLANGLTYEFDPESKVIIVKKLIKPSLVIVSRVYFLKYARLSSSNLSSGGGKSSASGSIVEAVKNVLSDKGKILENPSINALSIVDIPAQFPLIERVIASLDVPTPQVMIEVEILDVDKETSEQLGMQWGSDWWSITGVDFPDGSQFPFGTPIKNLKGRTPGTSSMGSLSAALTLLTTNSETKFLARPRLLTLSNEPSEIKITTDEAIGVTVSTSSSEGASTTTQEAERAETGVSLKVTPVVNLIANEITMLVEPKVSEALSSSITLITAGGVQRLKDPEERSTKTMVKIKNGQTMVVGGLIRRRNATTITKVPFLGDLPFVGAVFRSKSVTPEERELIVFLTPKIIMDNAATEFVRNAATSGGNNGYHTAALREQGYAPGDARQRRFFIDQALSSFSK